MAGDQATGVCIMQMEAGLDTGPVLLRKETDILPTDTTQILHDRLAEIGSTAIVEALSQLDTLAPVIQPEDGVTYAKKIEKAEAQIDWTQSAEDVDRHIRGLSPFPGAWFAHEDQRIKVLMSQVVDVSGEAGEIIDQVTVACGSGAVALTRLQRAGKGAMDADVFTRGYPLANGTRL
jgi:methionyl-tRNA formyltransferase